MGRRSILALRIALCCSLPTIAEAQWTIEESDRVADDRPAATVANLVSDDGMFVFEYTCAHVNQQILRGNDGRALTWLESMQLLALKPDGECCDDFASGVITQTFHQQPKITEEEGSRRTIRHWNWGEWWLAPTTRDSLILLLNGMRKYNYLNVAVEKKMLLPGIRPRNEVNLAGVRFSRFNLAGTTAMLNEISCPTVGQ